MKEWFGYWYNKYAVIAVIAVVGVGGYNAVAWSKLCASDWGTWVGAVGTVAAFAGTIWLARQSDIRRAQEPVQSLEAIFKRINYFFSLLRKPIRTDEDVKVMLWEIKNSATPRQIEHIRDALDKFPIDRLTSMELISATFEMQGAVEGLLFVIRKLHATPEESPDDQVEALKELAAHDTSVRFSMNLLAHAKNQVGLV